VRVIFPKARPTCTTKNMEKLVIGLYAEKTKDGSFLVKHRCGHAIYKIARCKKRLIPIAKRER
jgi:hypothetical protein